MRPALPTFTLSPSQRQLLLQHLRRNPRLFAGLGGLSLLSAVMEALSVFVVLPLVSSMLGAPNLSRWCLILAALILLRSAAVLAHAHLSAQASAAAIHQAKKAVMTTYANFPDATFLEEKGGRMSQRLFRGSQSAGIIVFRLPQAASEALRALLLVGLLLWLDFRVAIGLLLAAAALWETFSRTLSPRVYAQRRDRSAAEVEQNIIVHEILQGARQLKLAGALGPWLERFTRASGDFSRLHAADMTLQALPAVWFEVGAAAMILGWLLASMWWAPARGAFSVPILAAIAVGAGRLLPCLASLERHRLEILGALPDVEAMEDFLRKHPPAAADAGRRCEGVRAGLRFENVRFTYPGRTELLKDIDLEIPVGRCVLISGPYGCGKTTMLGLLLGLHEPSKGRVLLDGEPLPGYDRTSWWRQVGVVPQDAFLFHGTVAGNILLSREGYDQEAVERAAKLVGVHDLIMSLPQGYETTVGERGLRLSGGQRQLVLLARALLTSPQVLVLDEPTQGLDPAAQEQLARVLRRASAGRAVIVATHRTDWAAWADAAFLLQDGRLGAAGGS